MDFKAQAAFEQMEAIMRDFVPVIGTYFNKLMMQGFTRREALALTINLQTTMLTMGASNVQGGDK